MAEVALGGVGGDNPPKGGVGGAKCIPICTSVCATSAPPPPCGHGQIAHSRFLPGLRPQLSHRATTPRRSRGCRLNRHRCPTVGQWKVHKKEAAFCTISIVQNLDRLRTRRAARPSVGQAQAPPGSSLPGGCRNLRRPQPLATVATFCRNRPAGRLAPDQARRLHCHFSGSAAAPSGCTSRHPAASRQKRTAKGHKAPGG